MSERPYEFRRRLEVVHRPDRRDLDVRPAGDEIAIGEGWAVVIAGRRRRLCWAWRKTCKITCW